MGQNFNPDFLYLKEVLYKEINVSDFEFLSKIEPSSTEIGLIQRASACSPAPNKSSENITEIRITNKRSFAIAFEETIENGADISEHFLITDYPSLDEKPISEFLKDMPSFYLGEGIYLKWNSPLAENSELVFDIQIELSNGAVFNFEDEKMKLRK